MFGNAKVFVTNSQHKPGPKETPAEVLYAWLHQAYWGFRFLRENHPRLWQDVLKAQTIAEIQSVGTKCRERGGMKGAGFGARLMMQQLRLRDVARQILKAKRNKVRWPGSLRRESSEDKRLIFLGIAVAAGVCGIKYSTALRKLAQAKLGAKHIARQVHHLERATKQLEQIGFFYAEPIGSFFSHGTPIRELPCPVPQNCGDGFILYGYTPSGFKISFSKTLPADILREKAG